MSKLLTGVGSGECPSPEKKQLRSELHYHAFV